MLAVYVNGLQRYFEPKAPRKTGSPRMGLGAGSIFTKKRGKGQGF